MDQTKHQKIITENREYLTESIDLSHTAILDHLVQRDVLTHGQLTGIHDTCSTNMQKVSAVLDHLYWGPPEDWRTFIRCLSTHHHQHIVDQIRTPHIAIRVGPGLRIHVEHLQELIAKTLAAQYGEVQTCLWPELHDTFTMEEKYFDLVLVNNRKEKTGSRERVLRTYKDIFKHRTFAGGTVYLTGGPGVGKSTLCRRMSVDWAKVKKTKTLQQEHSKFYSFKFVLPVFLRAVSPGQTLKDVLTKQFWIKTSEAEALCSYINANQESVLIICDGVDEYCEKTSNEVTSLLQRAWLPQVNLFLTSRTLPSEMIVRQTKPVTRLILKGLSTDGVSEYLRTVYKGKKRDRDAMLQKIRNLKDIEILSPSPAVLFMMATVWKSFPAFFGSVTEFYLHYLKHLLIRYEENYVKAKKRISPGDIVKNYHRNLMKIGQLAIHAMMKERIQLSFRYKDVIKQIDEESWQLGILIEEVGFPEGRVVIFPHKSLQDFFFSYYFVHCEQSRQRELLMNFCNFPRSFSESAIIRRFISSLGGEEIQEKIQKLISGEEHQVALMHTELQLEYLAEHQDAQVVLPRVVRLHINHRFPAAHYVRYLSQDGARVRYLSMRAYDERHFRLLQHLHAPHLARLDLAASSDFRCSVNVQFITQSLDKTLLTFPLEKLTLSDLGNESEIYDEDARLEDDHVRAVLKAVVRTTTLHDLAFYSTPLTSNSDDDSKQDSWESSPVKIMTSWMRGSGLTSLTLYDCDLTAHDVMPLIMVIPKTVKKLDVTLNYMEGLADMPGQASPLTRTRLQSLRMCSCDLTPRDLTAIIVAIPGTLTELDVEYNSISRNAVRIIKEKLNKICPQIHLNIDEQWL